jgi:transcriptional regulator with XRE-family HTH domain
MATQPGQRSHKPDRPTALAKIGRQVLRMRLYYRWSQAELGRRAKVSQASISRIERGVHRGLSVGRLGAVIDALHVLDVRFERPPTVPQTDLEIMLFGDAWQRAGALADRRLRWPERVPAPDAEVGAASDQGQRPMTEAELDAALGGWG